MDTATVPGHTLQSAISFAARAHRGQSRKDRDQTPYIAHPLRVMMTLRHQFRVDDETALVAAVLHDTIEDTTTDYDDLLAAFGPDVANIVAALTKENRLVRHERERDYADRLRQADWRTRVIKIADTYDNLLDSATATRPTRALQKAEFALTLPRPDEPLLQHAAALLKHLLDTTPRCPPAARHRPPAEPAPATRSVQV